jgi:hypothetical protein
MLGKKSTSTPRIHLSFGSEWESGPPTAPSQRMLSRNEHVKRNQSAMIHTGARAQGRPHFTGSQT